jgi:hypothetical protein
MIKLPDNNQWAFDNIKAVDPIRANRLENSATTEQIVDSILKAFKDVLDAKKSYLDVSQQRKLQKILVL